MFVLILTVIPSASPLLVLAAVQFCADCLIESFVHLELWRCDWYSGSRDWQLWHLISRSWLAAVFVSVPHFDAGITGSHCWAFPTSDTHRNITLLAFVSTGLEYTCGWKAQTIVSYRTQTGCDKLYLCKPKQTIRRSGNTREIWPRTLWHEPLYSPNLKLHHWDLCADDQRGNKLLSTCVSSVAVCVTELAMISVPLRNDNI